jgi:hypothetical protein
MNFRYSPDEEEVSVGFMKTITHELEIGTGYSYKNSDFSSSNSIVCKI